MELIVAILYCTLQINFIPTSPKHSNSDLKPKLEELFLFQSNDKIDITVTVMLNFKGKSFHVFATDAEIISTWVAILCCSQYRYSNTQYSTNLLQTFIPNSKYYRAQ